MATETAMAAITLAIRQAVQTALDASPDLSGEVVSAHPDKIDRTGDARINVFLVRGEINPFLRNEDLVPQVERGTKSGAATLTRRWISPLVLHYLISCYGDESVLVPQRLLAVALAALHRHPAFSPKTLSAISGAAYPGAPAAPESDFEPVEIHQTSQTLDDMHKLWSALKAPYALSALFEARTALIQSDPMSSDAYLVETLSVDAKAKTRE